MADAHMPIIDPMLANTITNDLLLDTSLPFSMASSSPSPSPTPSPLAQLDAAFETAVSRANPNENVTITYRSHAAEPMIPKQLQPPSQLPLLRSPSPTLDPSVHQLPPFTLQSQPQPVNPNIISTIIQGNLHHLENSSTMSQTLDSTLTQMQPQSHYQTVIPKAQPLPQASLSATGLTQPNNANDVIPPDYVIPTPTVNLTTSTFSMSTFTLTPTLSVTCFRRGGVDGNRLGPLFVVREFDSKVIRSSPKFSRAHAQLAAREALRQEFHQQLLNQVHAQAAQGTVPITANNANANMASNPAAAIQQLMLPNFALLEPSSTSEQAFRASIRQAMLNMNLHPESATKSEIRVLKAQGILGKRAPSCSLLSANDMCKLLVAFGKTTVAEQLKLATQIFLDQNIGEVPNEPVTQSTAVASGANVNGLIQSLTIPSAISTAFTSTGSNGNGIGNPMMSPFMPHYSHQLQPSATNTATVPGTNTGNSKSKTSSNDSGDTKRKRKRKADVSPAMEGKKGEGQAVGGLDALLHAVDSVGTNANANAVVRVLQQPSASPFMPMFLPYPQTSASTASLPAQYPYYPMPMNAMNPFGPLPPPSASSPPPIQMGTIAATQPPIMLPAPMTVRSPSPDTLATTSSIAVDSPSSPTPVFARVNSTDSQRAERELTIDQFANKFEVNDTSDTAGMAVKPEELLHGL